MKSGNEDESVWLTQKLMATTWEKSPGGKILKTDVAIAKNYLNKNELNVLGRIVNAYLELAEERALRKLPMTMEDWAKRLDMFIEFADRKILPDSGTASSELAKAHAESEFEKYRIVQDRLFESDFDKAVKRIEASKKKGASMAKRNPRGPRQHSRGS